MCENWKKRVFSNNKKVRGKKKKFGWYQKIIRKQKILEAYLVIYFETKAWNNISKTIWWNVIIKTKENYL